MKIDTFNGWFKGVGDIVCFAWLGEGMLRAGEDVEFLAHGWRAEMLRMFQMPVTDDPSDAVLTREGYETAVRTHSPLSYLEWIAHHLGITAPPCRPRLNMVAMDREMGRRDSADVIIFPCSYSPVRTWPRNYFVELGLMLRKSGYTVKVCTEQRDYAFFMPFHCIIGKSWNWIAAAMQSARLVIGNDSGPAHLAGTIGTKTIAIQGATTERIYRHIPEVISYRKKALPCAGCHCLKPDFRASCEVGCLELYRTFPEEIAELAVEILTQQELLAQAMKHPGVKDVEELARSVA
jgi:ADP-heptose:LPS heptosyltransferase